MLACCDCNVRKGAEPPTHDQVQRALAAKDAYAQYAWQCMSPASRRRAQREAGLAVDQLSERDVRRRQCELDPDAIRRRAVLKAMGWPSASKRFDLMVATFNCLGR